MYNSIYPINIKPYSGSRKGAIASDKEDESSSSKRDNGGSRKRDERQKKRNFYSPPETNAQTDDFVRTQPADVPVSTQYDYNSATTKNAADFDVNIVNIAQIIADFKNTALAIGVPEDLNEELNGYFNLVEKQALRPEPNKKLIQSNLKNASLVLDNYISDTLSRESKVVTNWIDTLFMQRVDYHYNEAKINPDFQLQFPERQKNIDSEQIVAAPEPEQTTQLQENATPLSPEKISKPNQQTKYYMPSDKILKKLFVQAKKYSMINEPQKALNFYQQALTRSIALNDVHAQSMIYYEAAQVFDKKDLLEPALKNYYKASKKSPDYNIRAKAHYNMAKIYDDFVKMEPAIEHYYVALSYAGETENIPAQSASLANIAGIYAQRFQKSEVRDYTKLATNIAKEAKNHKVLASSYARGAKNYAAMGESKEALSFYKKSTKQYNKIKAPHHVARNFEQAAELMLDAGNLNKAKNLYRKAYEQYLLADDEGAMQYVFAKLKKLQ